jgi:tetratricopeptide repeat protein
VVEVREVDTIRVAGPSPAVTVYQAMGRKGQLSPQQTRMVAAYSRGLSLYRSRDWTQAAACFDEALQLEPADGPAATLLARCGEFVWRTPEWLGDSWDGAFSV